MSQYPYPPSPYVQPPITPGGVPVFPPVYRQTDAGRSASVWLIIVAVLFVMAGFCIGSVIWQAPTSLLVEQLEKNGVVIQQVPGWSKEQLLRLAYSIFCGVALILGIALLLMSIFVRRGGKISAICSGVLMSGISLFVLLNVFSTLFHVMGNPMAIVALLPIGGTLWLCVTTTFKLFAAFQNAGSPSQLAAAQQAQYWTMMMQQQQGAGYGYGTGGSQGYGYPAPPAAPTPPSPNAGPTGNPPVQGGAGTNGLDGPG